MNNGIYEFANNMEKDLRRKNLELATVKALARRYQVQRDVFFYAAMGMAVVIGWLVM